MQHQEANTQHFIVNNSSEYREYIRLKVLVSISVNFQWRVEQHLPEFPEKRTSLQGIAKFSEIFHREFTFHLTFLPESLKRLAFRKFNNYKLWAYIFTRLIDGLFFEKRLASKGFGYILRSIEAIKRETSSKDNHKSSKLNVTISLEVFSGCRLSWQRQKKGLPRLREIQTTGVMFSHFHTLPPYVLHDIPDNRKVLDKPMRELWAFHHR